MELINPKDFKNAFLDVILPNENLIREFWTKKTKYTKLIFDLFPLIAKEINLNCYNKNYYYLDTIFYKNKDDLYFTKNTLYAEYIAVAIEHEHEIKDTAIEMNKLQLFNAQLKVLITYSNINELDKYLSIYSDIINKADIFNDISSLRKQLVIFGIYGKEKTDWRFYLYNNKFLEI